jgi:phage-related protein
LCTKTGVSLAEQPTTLGEPHSRHLGGKLRELRFRLGDAHQRITYWLAPGRRVVLLTVFRKPVPTVVSCC